jgi:hypothetical protein
MKNIATALVKAQSEMSNPTKGNTNPFFKSKYADLNSVREAVIPILNANGIVVLQPIVHLDNKNFVKTVLIHESGETLESFVEIIYNKQNDAQAQGSGITYARRYGLQSFVCVGADDDDGQKAVAPVKIDKVRLETRLKAATTLDELGKIYLSFTAAEKQAVEVLKNELKESLKIKA